MDTQRRNGLRFWINQDIEARQGLKCRKPVTKEHGVTYPEFADRLLMPDELDAVRRVVDPRGTAADRSRIRVGR